MRRRRIASFALLTLFTFGACTGDEKPTSEERAPAPSDSPSPQPERTPVSEPLSLPAVPVPTVDSPAISDLGDLGEVVATVQIPTGTQLRDLAAIVDGFKAGSSAAIQLQAPSLLGQLIGMTLDGVKLTGPISIVVVDPAKHVLPVALLVEVEDLAKLQAAAKTANREVRESKGVALVGPSDVVEVAEKFAFANLTKQPDHTEIVVYPAPLVAAFGPKIEENLAQLPAATGMEGMVARMLESYVKMLTGLADQTQRIVISASGGQTSSDLYVRFYPLPGSAFAGFVAAQNPADHALLTKLPAGIGQTALISGELHAGPAKDLLLAVTVEAMRLMYQSELSSEEWLALFEAWLATLDGKMAAAVDMTLAPLPSIRMASLLGTTDSAALRAAWRPMMAAITEAGGISATVGITLSFQEGALEHDGVPIDLYATSMDLSKLPPESQAAMKNTANQSMHLATFDHFAAMASASDDKPIVALIDAARGKGETLEISGAFEQALSASKGRGESLIYWFDISKLMDASAPPAVGVPFRAIAMGMGKQGEALSLCISLRK